MQGGGLNGSKMMIKTKMVYRAYYSSLKYGKIIDTKHNQEARRYLRMLRH